MSQFRIKKVDTGLPDEWVLRTNDDGATLGDDIVAEDPNDLARAMEDTQNLLLQASVYAPSQLLDPNSGALERIKLLEDNVGSISLQDAYANGNFINVTPGTPLSLGSGGVIVIDSLNNLTFNPSTMKVIAGSQEMIISHTGIQSSTNNMTVGTSSPSRDLTLIGGNEMFLDDGNLLSPVKLSDTGVTALNTTAQNIVGAINEINGGFSTTDLQQIYDQSSPGRILTNSTNGAVQIENGSGSAFTPALRVTGIMQVTNEAQISTLKIGPIGTTNLTINSSGLINSTNDIKTSTKVVTGTVESEIGSLELRDALGAADLTSITDTSLNTTKQTIFGSINEVNTIATQNATTLAAFDAQHNTTNGFHEVIITQANAGFESDDRFVIKNASGTDVLTANGLGEVTVQNLFQGAYDLAAELIANDTHRNGDGSDHSAVAAHFADPNPHNTVKFLSRQGSPKLTGDVVLKEGPGITLVQTGNDIEIQAAAGSTLQGVYDTQVGGDLVVASGKNLLIKNDTAQDVASFLQNSIELHKDVEMKLGAGFSSNSTLPITTSSDLNIESTGSDINLTADSGNVYVAGIKVAATSPDPLPSFMPDDIVSSLNQTINEIYFEATNNTNETITKGTAVNIDFDNYMWTVNTTGKPIPDEIFYNRCFGVADEDILAGQTGRIKRSGEMIAEIGIMDGAPDGEFQPGDTLYVARQGYAEVEFTNIATLANNDTITVDVSGASLTFTAKGIPLSDGDFQIDGDANAFLKEYKTLDAFLEQVNNQAYQIANGSGAFKGFQDGERAEAHILFTGTCTAGDTFQVNALSDLGVLGGTLTAVALGSKSSKLEFEVGVSAEHTAKNFAEAINENTTGSNSFRVTAHASGTYVNIKAVERNVGMNALTFSVSSADITVSSGMSGGTSIARIYTLNRDANGKTLSTSNAGSIRVEDFTADENESQYIADRRITNVFRNSEERELFIKVGKVLYPLPGTPSPTATRIMLDIEEGENVIA
jgi:hypothetical protein